FEPTSIRSGSNRCAVLRISLAGDPYVEPDETSHFGNFFRTRISACLTNIAASVSDRSPYFLKVVAISATVGPLIKSGLSFIIGGGMHTSATERICAVPSEGRPARARSSIAASEPLDPSYAIRTFIGKLAHHTDCLTKIGHVADPSNCPRY